MTTATETTATVQIAFHQPSGCRYIIEVHDTGILRISSSELNGNVLPPRTDADALAMLDDDTDCYLNVEWAQDQQFGIMDVSDWYDEAFADLGYISIPATNLSFVDQHGTTLGYQGDTYWDFLALNTDEYEGPDPNGIHVAYDGEPLVPGQRYFIEVD